MQPLQIVRFGGYGDQIVWSSVLPFLAEKHHPITLETSKCGIELFLSDPRFDYISVFDVFNVPTEEERFEIVNKRWEKVKKDCERDGKRFLNFWSSIENICVMHEYAPDVTLTRDKREDKYNINYYDRVFEMAEINMPDNWIHKNTLNFTEYEEDVVRRWRTKNEDSFCVLLVASGSSRQKVFPTWIESFSKWIVDDFPKLKLYIAGGNEIRNDIWSYERTVSLIGSIPYKQAVLITKYVDFVFGPDTGLSIAAGMFGTPKTILFTLGNKDQIVRYHENDHSLQSMSSCSPCYVMAYNGDICPVEPVYNEFPICTHEFDLDALYNTIHNLYAEKF